MGTLEHRLGIGCRNYMLLNPDRMTMNYTMTDLVRACTTLACVACAHGDLLTIEPICMCRDALGPSRALMSDLALRPACQFMTGYVCASYCPGPVSDALHDAACAALKWLRPAAVCRSCQFPQMSAGPAPTSSHCTARSTRRSLGRSTSRWPWPTRVRLICPCANHI